MSYTIHEEYRLIELREGNINRAWKGAHLLLFFLAFVFGSFCTFCFHMLMYLFDEKCVLFPKLLSLTSQRHNVIYEFIPSISDLANLPVDFVSTQWVDKSICELPTYVPLVSGIFGLVWTTVFLMCSTGSRSLTGLQRPWRVLPPVFVFSLFMGGVCVYSSIITHNGLEQLCIKLGEITGSSTCAYTVNVATLTHERRIRGVYQATRLTILTAWLHTACWLCSALLTAARVLLVVDFQLVRINVSVRGDINKIMEQHEKQIRSVMPEYPRSSGNSASSNETSPKPKSPNDNLTELLKPSETLFYNNSSQSKHSLVYEEIIKMHRTRAYLMYSKDQRFIVKMVHDFFDNLKLPVLSTKQKENISIKMDLESILPTKAKEEIRLRESDAEIILPTKANEEIRLRESDAEIISPTKANEEIRLLESDALVTESTDCFSTQMKAIYDMLKAARGEKGKTTDDKAQEAQVTDDGSFHILAAGYKGIRGSEASVEKSDKTREPMQRPVTTQTAIAGPSRAQRMTSRVILSNNVLIEQQSSQNVKTVDAATQTKNKEKQD